MKAEEIIAKYIPEPLRPFFREPLFDIDEVRAYAKTNAFAIPALLEQRVGYWTRRPSEEARLPPHALPFAAPSTTTAIPLAIYEQCALQHWRPR